MKRSQTHPIRRRRQELGLSPTDLAYRVRISVSHLYNLEKQENCPSLDLARRIADALGTTLDVLWPPQSQAAA